MLSPLPPRRARSPVRLPYQRPASSLPVERWIELKLASGMVAAHRLKDLADVQELIRSANVPRMMADALHPWVRDKFVELWQAVDAARGADPF